MKRIALMIGLPLAVAALALAAEERRVQNQVNMRRHRSMSC